MNTVAVAKKTNVKTAAPSWQIFKQKRDSLDMTLRDVEEFTGVDKSTVSRVESETHIPNALDVLKLVVFYEIDIKKEFFGLTE